MASRLNPYLNFNGTAREAMQFYQSVLGGDLVTSTFADFGAKDSPDADRIMHAQLETPDGYCLMASDITSDMEPRPVSGFSVSLSGDDEKLRDYFGALAAGGTVVMPLEKQAWGDEFGMCIDRFGVSWLVNIGQGGG